MAIKTKSKRPYRQITNDEIARYKVAKLRYGNGTQAVIAIAHALHGTSYLAPHDRSFRILKKAEKKSTLDFIDEQFQRIGIDAVNRVGQLTNSRDERIATKNSHFVIDHLRGKATQKSISLHGKINIQNILD